MILPVAIIGAGPAGIAAAIQLQRSRIKFLLFEKDRIGGLLNEANRVENFPGLPGGVPGRALAARLRRQLAAAGIGVEKTAVRRLAVQDGRFAIETETGTITAGIVILACGTRPLPTGPPLDTAEARGRLFDGVLPLLGIKGETIVVIGGGDAACDYALSLAAKNRVRILVRSPRPRALPLLIERCRRHPGITIHTNFVLTAASPSGTGEIVLQTVHALNGRKKEVRCQRILSAIGRAPALDFLAPDLRAAMVGLARKKKLFLVGDAGNGRFRQAAIAAADGLRAAMEIHAGEGPCK
jgi:thioredoxin reductase